MIPGQKRVSVALGLLGLFALFLVWQLFSRDWSLPGLGFRLPAPNVLPSWPYVEVVSPLNEETWPYRVFKSSPLNPPNISIGISHSRLADGYLFLTPGSRGIHRGEQQNGPHIITPANELVYASPSRTSTHFNGFRVQRWEQAPCLTFWRGDIVAGRGYGDLVLLDDEYRETSVSLQADIRHSPLLRHVPGLMDFHEQELTPRNTVLVTAYNETSVDLSPIGGLSNGTVTDSMFFEVDMGTGQVLFSWSALDLFPITSSRLPIVSNLSAVQADTSYDAFHINSVQLVGQDYLISSRHHWAVYLVSGEDGHVIWTLGGDSHDASDFGPLPVPGQFRWQHDVRAHNVTEHDMLLSLFDNHCRATEVCTRASRGLLIRLRLPPDRRQVPEVVRSIDAGDAKQAPSQGNFQIELQHGNQLASYGPVPVVREFGPPEHGSPLLWEGRFGHDDFAQSYRAYKSPWHATPRDWDPSLVLVQQGGRQGAGQRVVHGHVSWNGATDVERWNVYMKHPMQKRRTLYAVTAKMGFETVFELALPDDTCVQVAAVQAGHEVRLSNVACL
ncbi:ASST-domain-containing protein [Emericellopsis atlantica]|uniref:ASST-domain-containing protein n=1 Tax=Emericellopsis atlantica TaxID=2614577 RepID=A0A9P7ZGH2_9HYPO|nr:ASST-domain-containing protein [Emericellopsis atlantica]KAG9251120.1 ASST-domain-containing protein [Emericellopsis atlantica]